MAPVAIQIETQATENGKVFERSQEDGEMYSKPTIGIIYPPPEVRNIVDRTALFVAKNGPEFEDRIRANEADNLKFNFLNPNDPYHAYYEYKLKDFRENDAHEPEPEPEEKLVKAGEKQPQKLRQTAPIIETIVPKDPPPVYEYMADPPTISAIDLDIVKLTAQFVAKNGKGFLTNLMTREQILLPPSDITHKLTADISDPWKILERVNYRVEWQRYQEREKRKVEDEKERERIAFAQIDWHDFVVVETVNFRENETANLPPPVSKDQLGARILAQERFETIKKSGEANAEQIEMDVEDEEEEHSSMHRDDLYQPEELQEKADHEKADSDMEEESDDDEPRPPDMPPPMVPPVPVSSAQIRKGYDPKAQRQAATTTPLSDKYLISPLTGEKVPVESMAAHMKISLLDPRWKEQKEKSIEEKRQQEQVFAEGVHIGDTLKQLAERRSDIFGVGVEETLIGRKLGEDELQKKPNKEIWDGHTASMERATKIAHSNITFEDQIKAIHKSKGLLPSDDAEKIGPAAPIGDVQKQRGSDVSESSDSSKPQRSHSQPITISSSKLPAQPSSQTQTLMNPPQKGPSPVPIPPKVMGTAISNRGPPSMPQPSPMNRGPMPPMGLPPPLMPNMGPPNMPTGMMMPPRMPNMPPPQPGSFIPPPPIPQQGQDDPSTMDEDEPVSKKIKVDLMESDLIPEQQFLMQNRLPVTFRVQVPEIPDKADWQCQGQVLKICLPLSDSCSAIKAKVHEMIGMPAGKQKLQLGNVFVKDSNTLAYYNFTSASLIQLQVKERGGRKK